jgi:hypothetical protein
MLGFRLMFFPFLFNLSHAGMIYYWFEFCIHSGYQPACSLSCPVGWEQIYSWWTANSHKQPMLHVRFTSPPVRCFDTICNCLLNPFCTFADTLGAPALYQLVSPTPWPDISLFVHSLHSTVEYSSMKCWSCLISCSASRILCSSGSLQSSLLHGARYLWQWFHGKCCDWPWPSSRCTQQGYRECCCQASTCPQGKRQARHVLLLRCWTDFTEEYPGLFHVSVFFPVAGKQHFYAFTNCLHCSGDFKHLLCSGGVMNTASKL